MWGTIIAIGCINTGNVRVAAHVCFDNRCCHRPYLPSHGSARPKRAPPSAGWYWDWLCALGGFGGRSAQVNRAAANGRSAITTTTRGSGALCWVAVAVVPIAVRLVSGVSCRAALRLLGCTAPPPGRFPIGHGAGAPGRALTAHCRPAPPGRALTRTEGGSRCLLPRRLCRPQAWGECSGGESGCDGGAGCGWWRSDGDDSVGSQRRPQLRADREAPGGSQWHALAVLGGAVAAECPAATTSHIAAVCSHTPHSLQRSAAGH
jgi:hypothetical protein